MKIRTKIEVTYNSGIKSTETAIVEGHILNSSWTKGDYSELGFNYAYSLEPDEAGNITVIHQGGFTLNEPQIEGLYQAIKGSVPSGLTYAETQQYLHYLGFIIEMAQTFNVDPSDLEIV